MIFTKFTSETDIAKNAAISSFLNCMKFRGSFNKTQLKILKEARYSTVVEELSGIIEEKDGEKGYFLEME